jgi:subtilisin family serine protease
MFPTDDCEVPEEYNHGTHIAGLASGRLYSKVGELNSRIELMILKVADSKGKIDPGNVANAIYYAYPRSANVFNLSLTGPCQIFIRKAIEQAESTLFVAAAGNPSSGTGIDLDDHSLITNTGFSARLTRSSINVISVAAHAPNGNLNCFSNFGAESVDLAAPGLGILSTVSGSQKKPSVALHRRRLL